MLDYITLLGLAAGTCTTFSFLPQVIKAWKTRSTKDISLVMFLVLTIGVFLWLLYGIFKGDLPVLIANAITFIFAATILYFKVRYG